MAENGKLPPEALAPIARGELRKDAAAAFNAMNAHARRLGVELYPTGSMSSYRTYAQQVYLYNEYRVGRGSLAAVPGSSNHGWGIAVDFATTQMRTMVDRIGAEYGWAKRWSDAASEPWHIKWLEGSWKGVDVGPYGVAPTIVEKPRIEAEDVITAVLKQDGAIEVFVEKNDSGEVWHAWQKGPNQGWEGGQAGVRDAAWHTMGTPGKK